MLVSPGAAVAFRRVTYNQSLYNMELLLGLIFGAVGTGYLIYGKRQQSPLFLVSGFILIIYPYLISNALLIVLIGAVIVAAPLLIARGII